MYFEIFKNDHLKKFWWVIKSNGNHETMAQSELLSSKQACLDAIRKIVNESVQAVCYDRTLEN